MKKICIINTGGTFNKIYNPINGSLEIDTEYRALKSIAKRWMCHFDIKSIINKDSLEMTDEDRDILLETTKETSASHIIIIHGTDTMHVSASYLAQAKLEKYIIFTGAMVPYSIDPTEATANLASAYGYLMALDKDGVYIAMNGVFGSFNKVKKDRVKGYFTH
ncbi:MAG: asparaginase domain-containing protein [Sulfurovum sp.]|nr:asparaginase domain-containing protein [Sulfurovum sp.]